MKTGALACIAIGLASHVALADPLRLAQAMPAGTMPPREVVLVVRSAGLLPTSEPALTGTTYVVNAVDRYGTPLRVAIDARNGYILSVRRFAVTEPTHPPYGALGMRERPSGTANGDTDLLPPRGIPLHAPFAPSAAPVHPPLPKPRAATVSGESAKPPAEPSPEPLSRPAPPPAANQAARQESFPPVTPLQ
jgi:hypothetical protein